MKGVRRRLANSRSRGETKRSGVQSTSVASPYETVAAQEEGGMKKAFGYLKNEQGIETLEWIAVGALIVAVALVVYPGTLQGGLQTVVQAITDKLTGIIT